MFNNFALAHIPTLFVAIAVTFGSMIPLFNAEWAITEFGLPERVAVSKEAQSVMILGTARATVIGASMLVFYYQGKLVEVDTIMFLLGSYVGAVDAYVCWIEGVLNKTVFRGLSGAAIAAWGWFGMTAGA